MSYKLRILELEDAILARLRGAGICGKIEPMPMASVDDNPKLKTVTPALYVVNNSGVSAADGPYGDSEMTHVFRVMVVSRSLRGNAEAAREPDTGIYDLLGKTAEALCATPITEDGALAVYHKHECRLAENGLVIYSVDFLIDDLI